MSGRRDGKARALLALMIAFGFGLLTIPFFFLTPPAFLELALRDTVFPSDLTGKLVRVTDEASGKTLVATIQESGGGFLAPVGRIDSGEGRSFTVAVEGYQSAPVTVRALPLHTVRAAVDLVPTFGRLEVSVVNATQTGELVPAVLKREGVAVASQPQSAIALDLPAGKHHFSAEASGFCPEERELQVEERKLKKVKLLLSPALTGDEIARFVLGWGENPRDLDAHFRKLGTSGAAHVYYSNMEGKDGKGVFARLDVDHRNSEGYETVTVYGKAEGEYEYFVVRYAGEGTLGASDAQVTVFTRGCQQRRFSVPPDCEQDIWAVTHLRVAQGRIEFLDEQACEKGVPSNAHRK